MLNTHHSIRSYIPDVVTLPEWFRRHGYTTVGMGKVFHQNQDPESWSRFFPFPGWISGYLESEGRPSTEFGDHPDERYPDGWMVRTASEWLEENRDGKEPFLMMVGLLKPHLPFVTPRSDFNATPFGTVPRPDPDEAPGGSPPFTGHTSYELRAYDDIPEGREPLDPAKEEHLRRGYAACVRFVDRQIGILLEALEATGLDKTTHVWILGDHGFHLGENGFWGKDSVFETSLITYLAYRPPRDSTKKIEPGVADRPLELVDLYPTLLDIAGLPEPYSLDGRSLFSPERPDVAFSMVQRHGAVFGFSVRDTRYRYTRWIDRMTGKVRAEELYDYDREPLEGRNRIGGEEYKKARKELAARMDSHLLDSLYHPDSTEWGTPLKPPKQQ